MTADSTLSLFVTSPLGRAAECAADATESIGKQDVAMARSLLREALRELDVAERAAERHGVVIVKQP